MLEVALPPAEIVFGPAVGTHGNRDGRIGENFQIAIGLLKRRLDGLGLFVVADFLLVGGAAERGDLLVVEGATSPEERLIEKRRSRFVHKHG